MSQEIQEQLHKQQEVIADKQMSVKEDLDKVEPAVIEAQNGKHHAWAIGSAPTAAPKHILLSGLLYSHIFHPLLNFPKPGALSSIWGSPRLTGAKYLGRQSACQEGSEE